MTDFAKLTGQPVIDESLERFECKPKGFENGSGAPLVLQMHPVGGARYNRVRRLVSVKVQRTNADKDQTATDDETLMAEVEEQDARTSEILARCCDGWNMTDGKEPMAFSLDAVTELFAQVDVLREVVDVEMTARGKTLRAKRTA